MQSKRWVLPLLVLASAAWLGGTALAANAPSVAKQIPADAAYVILVDRPGEAVEKAGNLIDKFKTVHPDMDMTKLGEETRKALGENVLTPEGMQALGLDPAGSIGVYGVNLDDEPNLAMPLKDAKLFEKKMLEVWQKKGRPVAKPKRKGGALYYKFGADELAIKGNWCLVMAPKDRRKAKGDPAKSFFGRGKKLAANKAFKRTLAGLPAGQHFIAYIGMATLTKAWNAHINTMIKSHERSVKKAKGSSKKFLQDNLTGMKAVRKRFGSMLRGFEGIGAGWAVGDNLVQGFLYVNALPAGRKVLNRVFPEGTSAPGFHGGLLDTSMMGGWTSLEAKPFIEWASDLPISPYHTIGNDLEEAGAEFKKVFQMDLMNDVIGNLRGPVSAYFLAPDLKDLNTKARPEAQYMSLVKFLAIARVKDRAKAEKFLAKVESLLAADPKAGSGNKLQSVEVDGVKVVTLRPEPSIVFSFACKGDAMILGVGENVVGPMVKLVNTSAWGTTSSGFGRGAAQVDFAVIGEVMSAAVSKGIGGDSGRGFRMTWPMIQQVLGRFGKIVMKSELAAGGLLVQSKIDLH